MRTKEIRILNNKNTLTLNYSKVRVQIVKSAIERFLNKISVSDVLYENSSCWNWISSKNYFGYGLFWSNKKSVYAHRFSYELYQNKIPKGLEIDHLCRNHSCVNPKHLEVVTHVDNMKRSHPYNSKKTHCPQGHEYDGKNIYNDPSNNYRYCVICRSLKMKEYNQRPDVKAKKTEYRLISENIIKAKEYQRRPNTKAQKKEYRDKPENKAKKIKYQQKYYQKHKLTWNIK